MRKLIAFALLLCMAAMAHADLVINEIMYNTPGYDNEWIEIYNAGTASVNLEGWYILDDDNTNTPLVFPAGYSIAAGEYFTVAIDHHEQADPFPFTPSYDAIGLIDWNLANGSDAVNLYEPNDTLHDTVTYDDADPWPTAPDGDGPSLELINPTLDNALAASWQASSADGGSPGEANSSMNAPVLLIDPEELDFEIVVAGQTYTLDAELQNVGTVDLSLTTVTLPDTGEFSINTATRDLPLPLTIAPGGTYDVTITCEPNSPVRDIIYNGQIVFEGNFTTVNLPVSYTIETEDSGAVINEIMYNSISYDNEWIELYNMDDTAFSLEGFTLVDDDAAHVPLAFPTGASIPAGGYYTVAIYHDSQAEPFPFTPDYDATEICEWNLNNTSDTINLYDANGILWDQVMYADTAPWPVQPDGNGPSLELIDPEQDNNTAENWQASAAEGGSPGEENSGGGGQMDVSNLAELRQQATGTTVYTVTGEVVVTFTQGFRNQMWLQDGTAGIMIDDDPGIITTAFAVGDGITGLTGTITEYGGMLEFQPTEDPGAATSTGNTLTPEVVTLAEIAADFDAYESEVVTILGLTFDETGSFANGTVYPVHDSTTDYSFRTTFYDVDYIGTNIPTAAINVTCIPNSRTDGSYITARWLSDFSAEGPAMNLTTNSLQFGSVMVNETSMLYFIMSSVGTEDVTITDITVNNNAFEFYADEAGTPVTLPMTLSPGFAEVVYVYFTPAEVITYTDQLAIEGNFDTQYVSLQGSGSLGLADIVINELMYNPSGDQGDDSAYEWLELYNAEDVDVDISGWSFSSGIEYTFDAGTTMQAGEYLVVAVAPDSITAFYGIANVVGPFSGGLNNTGELVQLVDASSNIVDFVEYGDAAPWPTAPDGTGPSLELRDPTLDNAFAESWQSSFDPYGTPGAENTETPEATPYTIYEIQYSEAGPSPHVNERVYTEGVVTAVFDGLFFIQDGYGPWNGVAVDGSGVTLGDEISLTATVIEYYNRTTLSEIDDVTVIGAGEMPACYTEATGTLAVAEALEGVLARVNYAVVTNDSLGYGEWQVNDGTGPCVVDNLGSYTYEPEMDDALDIRGPVEFSFSEYKIAPRDDNDIVPAGAAGTDTPELVTALGANYPNPFNPTTTVSFSLAQAGPVELSVYNIRGQRVRTLVRNSMEAGHHTVVWNGQSDRNQPVGSGLYLLRLTTPEGSHTRKALLLK